MLDKDHNMSSQNGSIRTTRIQKYGISIEPVTIVVKECILISSSMRKISKYSQSGVAAILGGNDLFNDSGDLNKLILNSNAATSPSLNDPLLSGFIQLRLMLNNLQNLDDVDSLTLLQPFLLVIKSSSTSGNITSLALDSLAKFISYNIISKNSKNLEYTLTHIINSLTHCRFEASEQSSDDAVLLKVLKLLEVILDSKLGELLSDEIIYEVVQTSLSLACNKRRSEVLRKAAELTLHGITKNIFLKLNSMEAEHLQHIVEETHDYSKNQLIETIGPNEDISQGIKSLDLSEQIEKPFGLTAIKQFLGLLISFIAPENQLKHTETTKVFTLSLICSAVELSGDRFSDFPTLLNLIADPVFKHTLQIIQSSNNLLVLQGALQLFTTLTLTLGEFLQPHIELTLTSLFKAILPTEENNNKKVPTKSGYSTPVNVNVKTSSAKELIIEEISILWTRSPRLFVDLFINYDCNFHRHDLTVQFINFLAKLSLPESSSIANENVPLTSLEGLLLFISNLNDKVKSSKELSEMPEHPLLSNKQKKKEFIAATNIFNKKPKDGLLELADKGFIKSADDIKDVALFFYEKSSRLNKKVLGEFLSNPSNIDLLKEFMSLFQFKGLRVDEALRIILKKFRLPGESQQIERIVEAFAARYVETQSDADEEQSQEVGTEKAAMTEEEFEPVRPDADAVFVLSYSVIMLNTDLYNPVVKAHMTIDDYKKNLKGVYGGKDFPVWYLEKIFQSIQDKEIVMPEEHHGSAQWFDDSWNNLIATNLVIPTVSLAADSFSENDILQFERQIFKSTFDQISSTVFKIFEVASDDQVVTKMMSTLEQLAQIASFFKLKVFVDSLVSRLAAQTGLNGEKKAVSEGTHHNTPLKFTRIKIENGESINISETSVIFGSNFKAQMSTVILFRVLNRNISILDSSWAQIFKILITLLQSGLLDPNIVPSFQEQNSLSKLPNIKPEVFLSRSATTKGLFSTFASYLKGEDEPTDEEIESTLSALDCIKSTNINTLFDKFELSNDHKVTLIEASLEHLPVELTLDNKKYFEAQLFFIVEFATALSISLEDTSFSIRLIQEIEKILSHKKQFKLKAILKFRLLTYKLLLINHVGYVEKEITTKTLDELVVFERKVFEDNSSQLIVPITKLGLHPLYSSVALSHENYWKILRTIASLSEHVKTIFKFTETLVKSSLSHFNQTNFMWLLGLLDEVSAVGAIGSQWEREYDSMIKTGQEVAKESPYQEIVDTSIRSIKFTSSLLELKPHLSREETYALVQALAHQCLNPCIQIRSYALSSLEETVLQVKVDEGITADDIFELGLFPLLREESIEKLEILTVISKVYLHFYKLDKADNQIFLKILDIFNQHIEDPRIEAEMQSLIRTKKELEKIDNAKNTEVDKKADEKKSDEEKKANSNDEYAEKDNNDLEVE